MNSKFGKIQKHHIFMFCALALFLVLWTVSYSVNPYNLPFYVFVSTCLLVVNAFCILFVLRGDFHPLRIALLIVALGTMYSFVLPACTVPDEDRHFVAAYKISNCIIYGDSIDEQNDKMLMRKDIIESLSRYYERDDWVSYYKNIISREIERDVYFEDQDIIRRVSTYYAYVFPGIVISLCRVMKLGAHMTLFIGREFNLLLFSGLIALCLKLLPQIKTSLTIVSLFPMTLVLAASFSYDCIMISTIFLLLAMVIKCILGDQPISAKDILIISLLFVFSIPIKLVYFPTIILLFCVSRGKFHRSWHKYAWIVGVCILVLFVILIHHGSVVRRNLTKNFNSAVLEDVDEEEIESMPDTEKALYIHTWNVSDIKSEPLQFVQIMFRTLINTPNQLFMNISGYYFGWFTYEIPITIACIFPVLFAISIGTDMRISFRWKDRIIIAFIIVTCLFLAMIAMLLAETEYGSLTVSGVQGRYLIPLMPLVAVLFSHGEKKSFDISGSKLISASVLMNSVVLLYLLNDVMFAGS